MVWGQARLIPKLSYAQAYTVFDIGDATGYKSRKNPPPTTMHVQSLLRIDYEEPGLTLLRQVHVSKLTAASRNSDLIGDR